LSKQRRSGPGLKRMFLRTGCVMRTVRIQWIGVHHCTWFRRTWAMQTLRQQAVTFMHGLGWVGAVSRVRCLMLTGGTFLHVGTSPLHKNC
jgi:hypothetical protein